MNKTDFNYKIEALAFLELKKAGKKITIKTYVEKRAADTGYPVSFQYFKKTLGQVKPKNNPRSGHAPVSDPKPPGAKAKTRAKATSIENDPHWPAIRDAFFRWEFQSLADVARHIGRRPDDRIFKRATAGWAELRNETEKAAFPLTVDALAKERAVQKVQDLYAQILAAHYRLADFVTGIADKCEDKLTDDVVFKTPWHTQMAIQTAIDLHKAMEKIVPAIKGLESLKAVHQVFDDLADGKIDVVRAAFDLAKLGVVMPKPIEILLTKHKADELPPEEGDWIVTDEAIMRRRAELLAEIETERVEFVNERKRIVAELKSKTADSFKAQRESDDE